MTEKYNLYKRLLLPKVSELRNWVQLKKKKNGYFIWKLLEDFSNSENKYHMNDTYDTKFSHIYFQLTFELWKKYIGNCIKVV